MISFRKSNSLLQVPLEEFEISVAAWHLFDAYDDCFRTERVDTGDNRDGIYVGIYTHHSLIKGNFNCNLLIVNGIYCIECEILGSVGTCYMLFSTHLQGSFPWM